MSGLLALLDDVAGIAKVAAASVDDVAAQAAKAGSKAAGIVIDDAAVTPKYVHGFSADRELPIIWKISKGSFFNKLVILLPLALLLSTFAPFVIAPLLMLGGAYLCFEGAEKVFHVLFPHGDHAVEADMDIKDPAHLETEKVKGAIKTDFILSAEIMTIALASIETDEIWMRVAALVVVALLITVLVYGAVAILVKIDDWGVRLSQSGWKFLRAVGRGLVSAMPTVLLVISIIGTAAMLWVGGSIVIHSLHELHVSLPYETIKGLAAAVPGAEASGAVAWLATALLDAVAGFVLGSLLMPLIWVLLVPFGALFPEKKAGQS